MKEKLHLELTVPKHWTPKQAKAIWEVHGDEIDEAIEEEQRDLNAAEKNELPQNISDDFPF